MPPFLAPLLLLIKANPKRAFMDAIYIAGLLCIAVLWVRLDYVTSKNAVQQELLQSQAKAISEIQAIDAEKEKLAMLDATRTNTNNLNESTLLNKIGNNHEKDCPVGNTLADTVNQLYHPAPKATGHKRISPFANSHM